MENRILGFVQTPTVEQAPVKHNKKISTPKEGYTGLITMYLNPDNTLSTDKADWDKDKPNRAGE